LFEVPPVLLDGFVEVDEPLELPDPEPVELPLPVPPELVEESVPVDPSVPPEPLPEADGEKMGCDEP
jgi:hypothetical protein